MQVDIIHHEPPYRVGYFVGSLASDSINRTLAKVLVRLAPERPGRSARPSPSRACAAS
ncbi:hypothetical protein [Agromyces italicus]|uniref:hypothetical protein n=1 Tax=Agromyces italicus TaxID=279572 RepID=UPI0003B61FC4